MRSRLCGKNWWFRLFWNSLRSLFSSTTPRLPYSHARLRILLQAAIQAMSSRLCGKNWWFRLFWNALHSTFSSTVLRRRLGRYGLPSGCKGLD
ncbi:hypothetical protein AVEN_188127-1 [Araneus ventricosus]|uniref:Secreted protein n=1 Tax=Araneus ventricosus TaxID=182803 RepID=A0A4Y2KRZ4_ARAVE|nr:hypothetical protein AVEN_31752-1 [Araneus ventricosus]GBN05061.1 hypothetical protein AVEN_33677-1 [Araneus ventricosus]GBN05115.1 hypothetical protein AVEN_80691-1 [Araneus ventricosus]GBN05248.1 hypothetical protein AVEN_188127-1 [Araneus ventricosus]